MDGWMDGWMVGWLVGWFVGSPAWIFSVPPVIFCGSTLKQTMITLIHVLSNCKPSISFDTA
jgi:hypothetical protein